MPDSVARPSDGGTRPPPHWCQNPDNPNGYSLHFPGFSPPPWRECSGPRNLITGEAV